jgi:NAD(P)-dependent dehydrogenase (short-subunit alcohol dehydrogenase family)
MTDSTRLVDGKVAIVTGAGRGLGREHALLLADHGARVLVNDLGADPDGRGADAGPAHEVAELIREKGSEALVNGSDVSDFEAAGEMVQQAVDQWGRVDILVNNAGILRDRMIFSMEEDDWDAVINVHLKGHFCPTRHVAAHWRARVKAGEDDGVDGRIVNTSSPSGLYGNVGQCNYGAAKAGIATLTTVWALELARLGVTVNCLAPTAMTRLVMGVMGGEDAVSDEQKEAMSPRWVSALVAWLCSEEAHNVTGRVFDIRGDRIQIAEGWHGGPVGENAGDPTQLGPVIAKLMAEARLNSDLFGNDVEGPGRPGHDI